MMSSSAAALAGSMTPRPMVRLKKRRPVAAQLITSAPATRRVEMPTACAKPDGAAAYMSLHAHASADSITAAVCWSTGNVSIAGLVMLLMASSLLRRGEVLRYHRHGSLVVVGGAELDDVGARLDDRDVPRRRVVGVARLVHLVMVRVTEGHPPALYVPPVRALAAVVRQPAEQWGRVDVLLERLEADRVAAGLAVAALHHPHVLHMRRARLR